jgi:hypothetical protein
MAQSSASLLHRLRILCASSQPSSGYSHEKHDAPTLRTRFLRIILLEPFGVASDNFAFGQHLVLLVVRSVAAFNVWTFTPMRTAAASTSLMVSSRLRRAMATKAQGSLIMGQAQQKRRAVLIVEDDAGLRSLTAALFEDERVDTIECESAKSRWRPC